MAYINSSLCMARACTVPFNIIQDLIIDKKKNWPGFGTIGNSGVSQSFASVETSSLIHNSFYL